MNSVNILNGNYDHGLVALSVGLAVFTSYAAVGLSGRIAFSRGWARAIWLGAGAGAMGLGIWAMHFVAMLALTLPMPVSYHLPTVMLSLLAAIAASAVALHVVGRAQLGSWWKAAGSLVMGSGITAMHYIGMAAMRCPAVIVYDRRIVALSIGLAIATSLAALRFALRLGNEKGLNWQRIAGAVIMGSGIALMHYTGMWAATFHSSQNAPDLAHTIGISMTGAAAIGASVLLVVGLAIAASFVDRFIATQRGDLKMARQRELYFQTMAEATPEIIWTADPDGADDYFNRRWFDYTGLTLEQSQGKGWRSAVHADDLGVRLSKMDDGRRWGKPFTVEYRLRGNDGRYRWFLCQGTPIRNAKGEIVKWLGTSSDIEDQKHNQQVLEQQILERTMQLADTNTRLQQEILEKDAARREYEWNNERMVEELQKRSGRATLLAQMGELLQCCMNLDEVFATALGFAPRIFPAARGAVALLNDSRSLTQVIGVWADCPLPAMEFEPTDCWALRTGHPHLVTAGDATAPCAHAAGVKNTYLCIPIQAQGETLGILHLQATDEVPQLDQSELSFKTTFAAQFGLSIANLRLREALRTQSVRDALTGLYNRRYLEEVLQSEVRRAARAVQSLGILMIDLDFFKKFNDTYGHDAGDAILRETGAFLTKGVRAEDFVCRFGGEEFVVILPTANLEAACARAERLRVKMKELTVMHQGRAMGMLTVSIGVAEFPKHGLSPQELMAAADAALYEAKRAGRDRVAVALVNPVEPVAVPQKTAASWK